MLGVWALWYRHCPLSSVLTARVLPFWFYAFLEQVEVCSRGHPARGLNVVVQAAHQIALVAALSATRRYPTLSRCPQVHTTRSLPLCQKCRLIVDWNPKYLAAACRWGCRTKESTCAQEDVCLLIACCPWWMESLRPHVVEQWTPLLCRSPRPPCFQEMQISAGRAASVLNDAAADATMQVAERCLNGQ